MAGTKTCSICKMPIAPGEKAGFSMGTSHVHKSCYVKKCGPLGFLADIVLFAWNPSFQTAASKSALLMLVLGMALLAAFGIIVFGLALKNWALGLQLLLLALAAIVVLGPILYGLYAFFKDVQ